MAKIRVHELAKEIGIPSKEMVDILQNLGMNVKNHTIFGQYRPL